MTHLISKQTIRAIKIRAFLLNKARGWLNDKGYIEVQGPVLIPSFGKSPNAIEVKYFDKKAYLAKGFLPYGAAFAESLEKVYTIMPAFRKESPSNRHLVEYWRLEVVQNCDLENIINVQEQLVAYLCHSILEIENEFKDLNRPKNLSLIKAPFIHITYDDAIAFLQSKGSKIIWGQSITSEFEQMLSCRFNTPFFICKYPFSASTLFCKPDSENPELSLSADLLAPETFGEIASCFQMETDKRLILKLLKETGLNKNSQKWFMELLQSECINCSAFAMGLERLTQWICLFPQITDTVPFPRTFNRIFP